MPVSALLLSEQRLLNRYLTGYWPTTGEAIGLVGQALREQQPFQPDYAIIGQLQEAGLTDKSGSPHGNYAELLLNGLSVLSQPLVRRGRWLHVNYTDFAQWQERLTWVMPLPLISFYAARQWREESKAHEHLALWLTHNTALPTPFIPELEAAMVNPGLSEHHMHIMGTTETDNVWLDAIARPSAILADLHRAANEQGACQQLLQLNSELQFNDMFKLLKIANQIRQALLLTLQGNELGLCNEESLRKLIGKGISRQGELQHSSKHPAQKYTHSKNTLYNEAIWLLAVYRDLGTRRCEIVARALHLYFLIQSVFHRMLSQQILDKGFQQFDKITRNELRETTEKHFEQRFHQLKGMYGQELAHIEARFAPKEDIGKLNTLLQGIEQGYNRSGIQAGLSLTAHFIKSKDKPRSLHPCRDYPLRKRLNRQAQVLADYLKKRPVLAKRVSSIDAAGNELDAAPDVFAPLFRRLRHDGWKYFTYHAGEDFQHLLGGMRQVFESMMFLELQHGDRIGHATAVGIEPALWLERTNHKQWVTQGEWLDTLLFTHHILMEMADTESQARAYALEQDILHLADLIYQEWATGLSLGALKSAWLNRWRDPLSDKFTHGLSDTLERLVTAWHRADLYSRARVPYCVYSDYLNADLYRRMQIHLLQEITNRKIALEALPTSNLRISYYHSYREHHLHRWLDPNETVRPQVVLGSDDPGIFGTNLKNEYAHILCSSTPEKGIETDNMISLLVRNSGVYLFREHDQ